MIAKFNNSKPRSKDRIYRELRNIDPTMPKAQLKILAEIAQQFDFMVRDTAEELERVQKENIKLTKALSTALREAMGDEALLVHYEEMLEKYEKA